MTGAELLVRCLEDEGVTTDSLQEVGRSQPTDGDAWSEEAVLLDASASLEHLVTVTTKAICSPREG